MKAFTVEVSCPACRDNVVDRRKVFTFARAYLCQLHQSIFDAADADAHRSAKACPWFPKNCPTVCTGATA